MFKSKYTIDINSRRETLKKGELVTAFVTQVPRDEFADHIIPPLHLLILNYFEFLQTF